MSDDDIFVGGGGVYNSRLDYAYILLKFVLQCGKYNSQRNTISGADLMFRDSVGTLDLLLFPYQDKKYNEDLLGANKRIDQRYAKERVKGEKDKAWYDINVRPVEEMDRYIEKFRCLVVLMKRKSLLPDTGGTSIMY